MMEIVAVIGVLLALAFIFTNGFQDASSIAATFIASRSAKPRQGIALVAGMNLLGALLGGSAVAFTLAGLVLVEPGDTVIVILLAALTAAIAWNVITWRYGLPSSSTHALVGGLMGAAVAAEGLGAVQWGWDELISSAHQLTGLVKILLFLVVSVLVGLAGGYLMHKAGLLALRNAKAAANKRIIRVNWAAAAAMGFFNGANDAQKQMGMIALILFGAGLTAELEIELWTRVACAVILAAGTLGGGWRIMRTLGSKIFRVRPVHSLESQLSSGLSIGISTLAGAPISSTHVISSSIIGVGAAATPRAMRWSVGKDILIGFAITIPITMLISGLLFLMLSSVLQPGG
jgi:PiT family inorganic phosphate transporter